MIYDAFYGDIPFNISRVDNIYNYIGQMNTTSGRIITVVVLGMLAFWHRWYIYTYIHICRLMWELENDKTFLASVISILTVFEEWFTD